MAYIGKTPVIGNFQKCDSISVVNGQAAYTLQVGGANVSPQSENHMLVSLNGILQAPVDSFTVSGSTLTFASNLITGDVIDFVMILGNVLDLGVPSDNTVSLAKLTATGTKDATTFLRGDNTFASAGGDNTPSFYAELSSTQNTTDITDTKIQFNSEILDTDSAYDNSTNYRFTVPSGKGGKYFVFTGLSIYGSVAYSVYDSYLKIYKNGSVFLSEQHYEHDGTPNGSVSFHIGRVMDLSAGDYLEVYNYCDVNGGNPQVIGGTGSSNTAYFGAYKLIGV